MKKLFHLHLKVTTTTKNETELFLKNVIKIHISKQLNTFLYNHLFKNSPFRNLTWFKGLSWLYWPLSASPSWQTSAAHPQRSPESSAPPGNPSPSQSCGPQYHLLSEIPCMPLGMPGQLTVQWTVPVITQCSLDMPWQWGERTGVWSCACHLFPHLFTFKHMADHFGCAVDLRGFLHIMRNKPPSCHEYHQVTYVCYVWYCAQCMVHHDLLQTNYTDSERLSLAKNYQISSNIQQLQI